MSRHPRNTLVPSSDVAASLAGDWRLLLVVGTGLVLQVSHPVIGAGVGEHSTYATDPFGRARRSIWPVLAMVILDDGVESYSQDLREMHRGIQGTDHVGRRYHAWDPEAAFFVLATAFYASEQVADRFGTPLTDAERRTAYAAWRRAGLNFGIPERDLPADLETFRIWFDNVIENRLEDHPTAHEVIAAISRPAAPPGVPNLIWRPIGKPLGRLVRLVTIGTMPAAARDRLGLPWTAENERTLARFAWVVRTVSRFMPKPIRQINRHIVRQQRQWMLGHVAHGAELGIAPSIAPKPLDALDAR